MGFLQGKRALIVGVASSRSIAWGIAKALHREGAELALTYQNERLAPRVRRLAADLDTPLTLPCDVAEDGEIEALFASLGEHWGALDIIVHSVAYAPRGQLEGDYLDSITREGFSTAHEISSYSFAALARAGRPLLRENASLLTLSYLGALRAVPYYNVMGLAKASLEANVRYMAASLGPENIRVNGISAGPIRTPAAKGIAQFNTMLEYGEKNSPLRRNVTLEEVGNAAAFLCSDLASGITGETLYVDSGYHITAMAVPERE